LFAGDSEIDELFKIFRVLSTPVDATWPGVSTLPDYKPTFPKFRGVHLSTVVRGLCADGLDLLAGMLVYEPARRISAKRALMHAYFNDLQMRS